MYKETVEDERGPCGAVPGSVECQDNFCEECSICNLGDLSTK